MVKRRHRSTQETNSKPEIEQSDPIIGPLEDFLSKVFRRSSSEKKGNISIVEFIIYLGIVLVTLVSPFLYSRLTTENFLTPKEFASKIALALLGGLFCVTVFLALKPRLTRTRLDFPLALFFGFATLSVLWNFNPSAAIRDLRSTFLILMLFPLIVNVVRTRWQVESILWVVVFAGIATSTLGIMETYNLYFRLDPNSILVFAKNEILSGKILPNAYYIPLFPQLANAAEDMGSIVSTFGNRNYLGTFAMFTAFLPLGFFFYYRNKVMKVVSLGLFGWMLYGLYITRCRAALIGVTLGIVFMTLMLFICDRKWKLVKKNAVFFIVAVSIIFVGLFGFSVKTIQSTNMFDKIKLTFTLNREISNTYERLWVWHGTIQAMYKRASGWIIGRGFGSFKHFFPYQEAETFSDRNQDSFTAVTFRQAHNDWLQLLAELGIIGLGLFLFLTYRFFNSIYLAIQKSVWKDPEGEMNGDHVLLIGLGAAMVAQMLASIPDFPFHRIETAIYAVVFLALVAVFTETEFFTKKMNRPEIGLNQSHGVFFAILALSASTLSAFYEWRCWKADEMVRQADMYLKYQQGDAVARGKSLLFKAIKLDPLPGDPYLKVASILEMEGKGKEALDWADKASVNINFNARSTYHSVVFRKMHIYYHVLKDLPKALEQAEFGLELTCGDARSIYYMYVGKIALDITRYPLPAEQKNRLLARAESAMEKAMAFKNFELQAKASLAVAKAALLKWAEAGKYAADVSAMVQHRDPTMLNIMGIAASNLGDNAKAEDALKRAVALQPDNAVYKRDLGVVYVRLHKFSEAREMLEGAAFSAGVPEDLKNQSIGLVASMTAYELGQVNDLLRTNKRNEAVNIMKRVMQSKLTASSTRESIAQTLLKLGAITPEKVFPGATPVNNH